MTMFNRESQVALNDVPKVHHALGCDPSNYAGCSSLWKLTRSTLMHNNRIIPEEGCSCHGAGGSPSNEVILSISGVPRVYEASGTYNLTISLAHSTYIAGGYMIWDYETVTSHQEMVRSTLKTLVEHYRMTTLEMIG